VPSQGGLPLWSNQLNSNSANTHRPGRAPSKQSLNAAVVSERPEGFTRIIRDFYRLVLTIRAEDLTAADRSALRSLFKAMAMLARTPATAQPPVIPPLPTPRGSDRRRSAASTRSARSGPSVKR
jgi:hypothetical protein